MTCDAKIFNRPWNLPIFGVIPTQRHKTFEAPFLSAQLNNVVILKMELRSQVHFSCIYVAAFSAISALRTIGSFALK